MSCDCEIYEICLRCSPTPKHFQVAAQEHDRILEQARQRAAPESALARAFIQWRKTAEPSKRAALWREIEDAAERLEEMSDG